MGEVVKGEQGQQKTGQRRYSLMDGQRAEQEEGRRVDGELSFHFLPVWLLYDEGHYSLKSTQTLSSLSFCHSLSVFVHPFYLSVIFLCVYLLHSVFNGMYYIVKGQRCTILGELLAEYSRN